MKYTMRCGKNTITLDTVTGNITGRTYDMKEIIKSELSGKWDVENKMWHVDNLEQIIAESFVRFERVYFLQEVKENTDTAQRTYNKARDWDNAYNEGGEGYNPYRR